MTEEDTLTLLKIVLLGPKACGKTSLAERIGDKDPSLDYVPTVGVDFVIKVFDEKPKIKLHIWDLSGDPRFGTLTQHYLLSVKIVVLVYDMSVRSSIRDCVNMFRQKIREGFIGKNHKVIVVGTHADTKIEFQESIGKEFAQSSDAKHFSVNTITGDGICDLTDHIKSLVDIPRPSSPYMLVEEVDQSRGCCLC